MVYMKSNVQIATNIIIIENRYSEHLNAFNKPKIYKFNLKIRNNTGHESLNINYMTLFKDILIAIL